MSDDQEKKGKVKCCVMNCQKEIRESEAIKVGDKTFCKICGVAYYRSFLNL